MKKRKWVEIDNESGVISTEYLDLGHFGLIRIIVWDEERDTSSSMSLIKLNLVENNEIKKVL